MKPIVASMLVLACVAPTCAQERHKVDPACTEQGQAMLNSAIESLTKAYELQPDDPITKYYLFSAYMRRYVCLTQALEDLGPDAANTDRGRELQKQLKALEDVLKDLDLDFRPYMDTPINQPAGSNDRPTAR